MAIMVPTIPYGYTEESREKEIFESLEKLSDDYFVFHSLRLGEVIGEEWKEKEIDFVVYNRNKGILFIEAKAGAVWCDENAQWRYSNGLLMKNPFKQAIDGKWVFKNKLEKQYHKKRDNIVNRCKFLHAVWFPSVTRGSLEKIKLPNDADINMILTAEDLINPKENIERIFTLNQANSVKETILSNVDDNYIVNEFLCPEFKILPSKSFELDNKRRKFDAMIIEQQNILNYLAYQRNAVINGAAGTGKTMIAVEKARRHSREGDKVLFLCFNNKLKEYLENTFNFENVDYYTIDGFTCKVCKSFDPDYDYLQEWLMDFLDKKEEFPYDHIIVDEGQDFGQERMEMDYIFEMLEEISLQKENGTFYIFYDKLQLIQSQELPKFIENADCKLTLYKNCRNTKKIANTSFKPLKMKKGPKLFDAALLGNNPKIAFVDKNEVEKIIDKEIKQSINEGMEDIQILSCAGSGKSIVEHRVSEEKYDQKTRQINFTTVRKFKGLEAEHIILIDVDKKILMEDNLLFYVGSSRAKFQLTIVANLSEEECREVINHFDSVVKRNKPENSLANLMGCDIIK